MHQRPCTRPGVLRGTAQRNTRQHHRHHRVGRNVLGLVVDLNQVHLQVIGQTGNGQLLGNLLCGLANALNGNGGGLANILNRLLGL
jgi:hypothetical protein